MKGKRNGSVILGLVLVLVAWAYPLRKSRHLLLVQESLYSKVERQKAWQC